MHSTCRLDSIGRVHAGNRRQVLYTCLFGYSEKFSDFLYDDQETDFVCFTDDPDLRSDHWLIAYVGKLSTDPVRAAKRIKHMPTERLIGYQRSLYIDNTIRLDVVPNAIFNSFDTEDAPLWLFRHHWRDCIYEEGEAVIGNRFDDPEVIVRQLEFYRRLGHPEHGGLYSSGFMLRRHDCAALNHAMLEWHIQVVRHSFRDQLSLPFITRLLGLSIAFLPGGVDKSDMLTWPVVQDEYRLPRDFDDQTYLALNPDIEAAGFNPRWHYFHHGYGEGRAYRVPDPKAEQNRSDPHRSLVG